MRIAKNPPFNYGVDSVSEHLLRYFNSYYFSKNTRRFHKARLISTRNNRYFSSLMDAYGKRIYEVSVMVEKEPNYHDMVVLMRGGYKKCQAFYQDIATSDLLTLSAIQEAEKE